MTLNNQVIEYWYTIQEYIHSKTNYAIALEGGQEVGKTHFLQEILPLALDNHGRYAATKVVYISLMAVKTLEQLQAQVKLSLVPIFQQYILSIAKNDTVKFQRAIALFSHFGFNPFEELNTVYKIKAETSKMPNLFPEHFDNLVLCFDDISQKYPYFELAEILAYVNQLAHAGHKIVMALDTDHLEELAQERIASAYNKICPIRLPFNFFMEEMYRAIVYNNFRDTQEDFADFLLDYQVIFLKVLKDTPCGLPIQIFKILLNKLAYLHPHLEAFKAESKVGEVYYEELLHDVTTLLLARLLNRQVQAHWVEQLSSDELVTFYEIVFLDMEIEGDKAQILNKLFWQLLPVAQEGLNLEILPADFLESGD